MTDELTPEQDAVRRLLAQARHDGPTPPAVVARLDDTLASLVAERGAAPSPVVDLGARRRRLAGMGLLAAAAVVVAGVAIGQGLPRTGGSSDSGSAAGGDRSTSQDRAFGDDSAGSAGGSDPSSQEMAPQTKRDPSDLPTLSSADAGLGQELAALRSTAVGLAGTPNAPQALTGCDLRGIGQGRRLEAQVDGFPGVVVFRRPDGAAQQVDVYVCGTSVPVRTLTLPAP